MTILGWLLPLTLHACEPLQPKRPPEFGRAKEGTADYKLINQSMRGLLDAVTAGESVPEGFVAEITPADWLGGPLKRGVLITGPAPAGHALGAGEVRITVQRYPSGCVVHLVGSNGEWERYVPPGAFPDLFPWRGPKSLLESLVHGVIDDPALTGWSRFDPLDPLGTRR